MFDVALCATAAEAERGVEAAQSAVTGEDADRRYKLRHRPEPDGSSVRQ